MCFGGNPPAVDPPQSQPRLSTKDLAGQNSQDPRVQSGFAATVLTGPRGALQDSGGAKKRLLGEA